MLVNSTQYTVNNLRKIARRFSALERNASLVTDNCKLKTNRGFSLIELLVSMALFIVVLTIGVGALLVLISTNLKAQNIQDAVGNVQFALDSMTREIRTGYSYYCASNVPSSAPGGLNDVADCNDINNKGKYLSIIEGGESLTEGDNLAEKRIEYRYNTTNRSIERRIQSQSSSWVSLTSPSVSIDAMHFNVNGTDQKLAAGDTIQPNVTIYIKGTVTGVSDTSTTFTMQTTVTQRVLDI